MTNETKDELLARLAAKPADADKIRSLDDRLRRLEAHGAFSRRGYRLSSPLSGSILPEKAPGLENAVHAHAFQADVEGSER